MNQYNPYQCTLGSLSGDGVLYYYDQSFTILEKNYSEMADKFSFDLRQIKKNSFFFGCDSDVNDWL
jgi:hypothetical protein